MDKLRMPSLPASQASPPASAPAILPISYRPDNLPAIVSLEADAAIPRRVWEGWIPQHGAQKLRRPLTDGERRALERRRDELAPAVMGYHPERDLDRVALALAEMFGGFTSMRQTDAEAAAKIDSVARFLAVFPAWAIEKACTDIRAKGVMRDGTYDRRWPPNDAEIEHAVRYYTAFYELRFESAVKLLTAEVAEG